MGAPMAGHLLDAGHDVVVTTRTRSKADDLLARGARWADTPADAADGADVLATMVGTPGDVQEVLLGRHGALSAMARGSLLVDFTTSDPGLAVEIAEAAAERGVQALDAPVSGGDVGARDATLSLMVGGDRAAFERARPLFDLVGATAVLQGGPGAGQHTKLVNQILIAGTMMGMCEALLYAGEAGLDPSLVLSSVGGGAAASWSLSHLAPRILAGDLGPGFFVEHFVKDLGLALDHARAMELDLPALALAHELYTSLRDDGHGRDGTQALVAELARRSNLGWP
jgi:3-hydroxyisobutyrate dehydrogenase